jgi:hypothetical protein
MVEAEADYGEQGPEHFDRFGVRHHVILRTRRRIRTFMETSTDALSRASTEELLLELRRRIIALHNRSSESWDDWGGLNPQGDWPEQG